MIYLTDGLILCSLIHSLIHRISFSTYNVAKFMRSAELAQESKIQFFYRGFKNYVVIKGIPGMLWKP